MKEDEEARTAICEICGQEFTAGIQHSDRVLCPDCELFDYDD